MRPRPVCVHCGTPYGKRETTSQEVRWPLDTARPPYQGNGVVIEEGFEHKTPSRATYRGAEMMSNIPILRAKQEAKLAALPKHSEMTATRWVWDGESWTGGHNPFCTLRCALDYARKAYNREQRK
jgi:hypothetical protein